MGFWSISEVWGFSVRRRTLKYSHCHNLQHQTQKQLDTQMRRILLAVLALAFAVLASALAINNSPFPTTQAVSSFTLNTEWQLAITGLVEHPLSINLSEISALPSTTENATLYCVDQPTIVRAQGNWTGVKLSVLLQKAGVSTDAIKVAFFAADGYSTDLTIAKAMRDDVILAYAKDDMPLGETLRLVVPGHWGYKWIAQVTKIELVDYNFLGIWETNGYSDEADAGSSGRLSPPDYKVFPSAPKFPYIPSPTSTPSLSAPTSAPTYSPSPSQPPSTTAPTATPSISASPTYAPSSEPDSSSGELPTFSILPYALASAAVAAVLAAFAMVLAIRKRRARV